MKHEDKIIIYNTDDGKTSVALYEKNWDIWMNQSQIAQLFDTSKQNISLHIQNITKDWELSQKAVVKDYLTTASDNKDYQVTFYSLKMILAIGFRVRSFRGIQFRRWAIENLEQYLIKGFVIDDERLKNPDGRTDYFDELLARIRDIRASEKRFYQKLRDLMSLSSDYDKTDKATQMFFAETQNKLLFAITQQTAAEIVVSRADAAKENMNLTNWKWNKVRKQDIFIAKNYLNGDEIDSLNRLVTVFLETAELRVKDQEDITIQFWKDNVDKLIDFQNKKLLQWKGSISHEDMQKQLTEIYDVFHEKRKKIEALRSDNDDMRALKYLESKLKK